MLHTCVCLCGYENDSISDIWQGLLDSNLLAHNVNFFIIYFWLHWVLVSVSGLCLVAGSGG